MRKRKTTGYCLLLLAVLLLAVTVLSVGETQARYINTVVWNTYVEPVAEDAADVTFTPDQSPTVLLGEMDKDTYTVQFCMQSMDGATGALTWSEDHDLEIRMQEEGVVLDRDYPLTLLAQTPTKLTMILRDQGQPREARTVAITVTWTEIPGEEETQEEPETLTATFVVELPAVAPPTEPPTEETEPTVPDDTTEPATEETSEPASEETSEPASEETSEPAAEETSEPVTEETSEPASEDTPAPVTEETSQPATEETTTPEPESTPAPAEETPTGETPAEEVTEPPLPKQDLMLEALTHFDPEQVLPVWIEAKDGAAVELGFGFYSDAASAAEMRPFPSGTRFSLDGGDGWFLLYQKDTISLDLSTEPRMILLDLSGAALATGGPLTLMAEGCSETTSPGLATATATPLPQSYTLASRIMAKYRPLQLTLTEHWPISTEDSPTDYGITCMVERLTITGSEEEGYRKEYEQILPAQEDTVQEETPAEGETPEQQDPAQEQEAGPALTAEVTGQTLTIRTGNTLPPPGTYRLSINWTYKGICISETQTTFFINYLNDSETAQTGGAEQ